MRKLAIILIIVLSMKVFASYPVDVYGTSQEESDKILKEYARQVNEISESIILNTQEGHGKDKEKKTHKALIKNEKLIKEIKDKYHFLYVDFSTIIYFDNKHNYFTTIEVVKANNPRRMRFIRRINKVEVSKGNKNHRQDIIDTMVQYHRMEAEWLRNKKLQPIKGKCPAYHCTPGFAHQKLKPYLKIFNTAAITEKQFILNTLKNDTDAERRAAAAFLVGHFSNPKEIISVLLPAIKDKSSYVRNNVMLMIATTMGLADIHQVDVQPFINYLDSPYATDRNKALGILSEAIESNTAKKMVIKNGEKRLIKLLQLKQPNNHDLAYLILKKISGKDFGEYNILAWKRWFSEVKKHNKVMG
ncbi:Uncharacterised protein [Legionella lansingensis]|uniref:HEAT repeat protein n=1 Tax=Legionella lansingensis TaxID=45067 RepID=A0A0W0VZH2_9GAMM|nr:HEAT repeat domain-containing protein [Legionella lansingensis]KTD25395.1 hypothetical protein Llan_0141 [Legionella lansingensis]SNV51349.1 Uncharacterised protein [Legionella lansingensis]